MPPPKKAAKKAAKKAPKKSAGHHHDPHHQANDLRRAYEHNGRLEVFGKALNSSTVGTVGELIKLAQEEINGGHNKDAADLLRASEHLSFANLASDRVARGRISTGLEQSITDHFDDLMRRADEHWEGHGQSSAVLAALYQSSRANASKAFKSGAYHRALEFARAAEALAHVRQGSVHELGVSHASLQLKDF